MDKKNVISLVLGLIIGALAIWLVMSFTDLGSTMVLRYSNVTKPTTTVTPTPTATQVSGLNANTQGAPLSVQCQNYSIDTQRFEWTSNANKYWMDIKISGEKCGDTFTITGADLIDMNDNVKMKDRQIKNPTFVDIASTMPNTDSDTINAPEIASKIETATGATKIAFSNNLQNSLQISDTLQSAEACSVKDAGWFSNFFKWANDWCARHPFACGMVTGILMAAIL